MKHPLLTILLPLAAAGLFLVAYLPLLVLSAHNHPSAADDYCFADTALQYGFWQAQKFYYDGWTGRYFSNMLVHGSPLVWGWYDGYRLIPALAATGLLLATYALISELLAGQPTRLKLLLTGLWFFLLMLALQSTVEAFFWTAAVAAYTIPTALTLYLLVVVIRWYRLPQTGLNRPLTAVLAAFLVFAVVGSGETNLVLLVLILLSLLAYRLLADQKLDPFLAGLVVVSLVSSWLLFRAPGNSIRMGGNDHSGHFIGSFLGSFQWLARSAAIWFLKTPILPLSLLWIPLALRLIKQGSPARVLYQLPAGLIWPILLTLLYIGLLAALIFPSYYGIGLPPSFRVMNVVYLVFLLGWFYLLTVWVGVAVRWGWLGSFTPAVWMLALSVVWLGGSVLMSSTLRTIYLDLWSGNAARYDEAMNQRHQQLLAAPPTNRPDTLRLTAVPVHPPTLFIEDMTANPKHWWNRCQASYYGHKAIILTDQPPAKP